MITELSFINFKSWKQVDKMRLAPITGLFGTNSSGKTSIFQLLLLIKQTVESTDRLQVLDFGNEKSPANLGSFRDVVYSHETPGKLEWSIDWRLSQALKVKRPEDKNADLFVGEDVGFSVRIEENEKKRLIVNQLTGLAWWSGQVFVPAQVEGNGMNGRRPDRLCSPVLPAQV